MDEGFLQATPAVVVYGPDGTAYGSPASARAAGVTNYTMQPPAGVPVTPISPRDSSVPFNPLSEEQRLNFNQFADAFSAYQAPNLAARAPEFTGYGYEAPTTNMVMAPQQMPRMNMNPEAINDPSVAAALQILNQPMMIGQMPNMMGSGTNYQEQYGLLPSVAAAPMQRQAMPQITPGAGLMQYMAGGESGDHLVGGDGRGGSDLYTYDPQRDAQGGGSRAPSWVALPADMIRDSGDNSIDSQRDDQAGGSRGESWQSLPADMRGDAASDSADGGKIVCTAMNEAYGFGSFRNRIWLAYAAKHLTKAHEAGYHALFLPLVAAGYKQDKWYSKPLRAVLEDIARHRSADLRAEMRGGKRDRVGQAYRFILEPLCYAVGKLKGK